MTTSDLSLLDPLHQLFAPFHGVQIANVGDRGDNATCLALHPCMARAKPHIKQPFLKVCSSHFPIYVRDIMGLGFRHL